MSAGKKDAHVAMEVWVKWVNLGWGYPGYLRTSPNQKCQMSTVVDWPCEWQGIRWFSGPRISKVTRVFGGWLVEMMKYDQRMIWGWEAHVFTKVSGPILFCSDHL